MAGGNYKIMDKVRPGAYFQRVSDSAAEAGFNPNGILCWVRGLRWGKPIVDIGLDDYSRNSTYKVCGIDNADETLQIWSQYGRRLILANPLQGGVKARAVIREEIEAGHKYCIAIPDVNYKYTQEGGAMKKADAYSASYSGGKFIFTFEVVGGGTEDNESSVTPVTTSFSAFLDSLQAALDDKKGTASAVVNPLILRDDGTEVTDATEKADVLAKLDEIAVPSSLTFAVGSGSVGSATLLLEPTQEVPGLDAVAAYEGSLGNEISLVIVKKSSLEREVRTTVNGEVVDAQVVTDWAAFVDNDWVHLEGERYGLPDESDPINLSGGVDGTLSVPERIISKNLYAGHYSLIDNWTLDTSALADPSILSDGEKLYILDGSGARIKGLLSIGSSANAMGGAVLFVASATDFTMDVDADTGDLYIELSSSATEDKPVANVNASIQKVLTAELVNIRYGLAEDQSSNYNVDKVTISSIAGVDADDESNLDIIATLYGETIGATLDDSEVLKIALPASRGGEILELHPYVVDADDDTKLTLLSHDDMFKPIASAGGMDIPAYIVINDELTLEDVSPNLGVPLDGGSHGLPEPYGDLLRELRYQNWSVIVFEDQSPDTCQLAINYVKYLREECGLYRRLVLCLPPAEGDYEHANNPIDWDFVTNQGTTWREDKSLSAYVRACMALCSYNQSNTYEAVPIADAPDQKLTDKEIVRCLTQGYSICTRRDDGVYVIEKDINCFHEYDDEKLYALTKNRVLRTVDYLCIMLRYYWELQFCGKVTNDDIGRSMWKARVQEILEDVQKNKGISDYTDPIVLRGNKLDEVITQIGIWPLDSMEIVYVQIKLNV